MLKNVSQLELKIVDRLYNFSCAPDSPIEHVKEALFQFQAFVAQLEVQIKAANEAASKAASPSEQSSSAPSPALAEEKSVSSDSMPINQEAPSNGN